MRNIKDDRKAKNFGSSLKKLVRKLKPYTLGIIIASIFSILSTALAIAGPDLLRKIVNEIQAGLTTSINMDLLLQYSIYIGALCLFCIGCELIQGFILVSISHNFSRSLRTDVSKKINRLPLKFFDSKPVGDTMSIITNDIDTIYDGLHQSISNVTYAVATVIGVMFMMFKTNWQMSLISILATTIGFILVSIIAKKSKKYYKAQQKNIGKLNGYIEEMYSCHNIVVTHNGIDEAKKEFKIFNDELAKSSQKAAFLGSVIPPLMSFVGNVGYIAVCIVGALLTMNNVIDFGTIIAFIFYVRLFSNPLNTIAQSLTKMQSVVAAAERVFDFMDEEEMPSESNKIVLKPQDAKGNITFENVCFAYDKTPVIKSFSMEVKAGQKVAIVGHTGAGKTTIVNLLMKFYDIQSGDIKIDGISMKDLSRSNIHDLFCMVLQHAWLFHGTIKENIIYNQENIEDIEVKKACDMAGISDFIESLPDEYDTLLSDTNNLSEGQKQLITIARAIVDKSPFIILDEATSSVDRKTEELVQRSMDNLMKNRTSFIIAHRLSTIQNADIILVLDHGDIVEMGSHDELIRKNGIYTDLYNSQFTT